MDLISPIFKRKKVNVEKLKKYGFYENNGSFTSRINILNDTFYVDVVINKGKVTAKVYDTSTLDEYTLVFMERVTGEFVGSVREALKVVLTDVASNCFDDVLFETEQANRLASYIYKTYHIEPDFPWTKYDDFAVFRNKENNLWFALFGSFVDKETKVKRIIANVKVNPSLRDELLKIEGIIPAYHMNKKSWITIFLDDTLNDEYIESLLDYSYNSNVGITKKRYRK